jgi:hypothetical protein
MGLNTPTMTNFLYIFGSLIVVMLLLNSIGYCNKKYRTENLSAVTVENAYSDTVCVKDDLPLVRLHPRDNPRTFRCLSIDGTNCVTRNSLAVPDDYSCNNTRKNVNRYLSVDGIRNVRVNPNLPISKVFNDFENLRTLPANDPRINTNISYLTCTQEGLKDPNHWCGKLWSQIESECSGPRGRFGDYRNICIAAPQFMSTQNPSGNKIEIMSSSEIAQAQKNAQSQSNNARASLLRTRN